jgi:hypothetical protein
LYKFLITGLFLLFSVAAFAQQISGSITDIETGERLPYSNIKLISISDSSFVSGVFSNPDGVYNLKFNLEKVTGKVSIEFSCIGYKKVVKGPFKKKDIPTTLNVQLEQIVNDVGPVRITARKPVMQVQAGKTTVDIADYCGLEKISIYTQLAKLQRNNKIEKRGDGKRGSPCVYVTIRQAPTATESSDNYENLVVKHAHNPFGLRL